MNKEYYKNAFSAVCPSDEAIERVLSMAERRKKIFRHKGLIIVLTVIAALICGTLTVNAATDGALFDNIKIIIDGEEVKPEDHIKNYKAYVNDDGYKITSYDIYTPYYRIECYHEVLLEGEDTMGETEVIIDADCNGGVVQGNMSTFEIK